MCTFKQLEADRVIEVIPIVINTYFFISRY